MAEELVLLITWASPLGARVRIALAEKGVEYEYREENLQEKSTLLLKSNPVHKKIPVLIHRGKPVCESLIILQYIDEVWKSERPLLPQDPYQRAQARFWADFMDRKIYDCTLSICKNREGEVQNAAKEELLETYKRLEGELGDKPFFNGDFLGYLDIALIPFAPWFYSLKIFADLSIEEKCPRIKAWGKRCMERESVSKVLPLPQEIYEFLNALRKMLGVDE